MCLKPSLPPDAQVARGEGGTWSVRFRVAEDFPYLEGHFPGNPIVPAVAQIGWVIAGVEALLGAVPGPYSLSRVKFPRPLLPGDVVALSMVREASKFTFRITANKVLCCSGTLVLEADVL